MAQSVAKRLRFNYPIYRLVIRNIEGYGTFKVPVKDVKRQANICPQLDRLKQQVLDRLLQKESRRTVKLVNWAVAWQVHAATGLPHLDLLVVYQKPCILDHTAFDYLIKKSTIRQRDVGDQVGVGHVWVTPYSSKKLNKAIIDYSFKEDPAVITNLTLEAKQQLVRVNLLKADPYLYLRNKMLQDPLHFNLQQYVSKHNLDPYIVGWSSIKTKLKDMQVAAANLTLKNKPGFAVITRKKIIECFTLDELVKFDSWPGYQAIIDKINEILVYGSARPFKSKQLLLVGRPDIGKTSLVRKIQQFSAAYHLDVSNWFPNYRDGVYTLIFWDQFKLKGGMSHTDLLKFLQGSPMDLQYKGGSSLRRDNQLIIMTSNMTLQQHIRLKFKDQQQRLLANANLTTRIQQVIVPEGHDLFCLLKLISSVS